jgi:hypothetical protein
MARSSYMAVLLTAAVLLPGGCDSAISPIQVAPVLLGLWVFEPI